MIGFSALTAPFVPSFNRCFEKITSYIVKKNPDVLAPIVNQDLKAIMLNVTATLLVTTAALAYFKMIATITAVVLAVLFYLIRRIIWETIVPIDIQKETAKLVSDLKTQTLALMPAGLAPSPSKTEPVKKDFYQGYDIGIGSLVIFLKLPHYPLPKMIGMIFTRGS